MIMLLIVLSQPDINPITSRMTHGSPVLFSSLQSRILERILLPRSGSVPESIMNTKGSGFLLKRSSASVRNAPDAVDICFL